MTQTRLVVDVCGTLFDENTTAGFVRFAAGAGVIPRPGLFRLLEALRRGPLRRPVIALGRLLGRDLFRTGYIRCLQGAPRAVLEAQAAAYAAHLDTQKRIPEVHARLARFEADGWTPVLVSNSLDVVVAAIAARRSLDWLASELGWQGELCTGRLVHDLKGAKLAAFEARFGPMTPDNRLAVMTDNRSDADVIAAADEAVLVAKGQSKPWMDKHVGEQIHH